MPSAEPRKFMLDTNVFNAVLDGGLRPPTTADRRYLVTGVQADECRRTTNLDRRAGLLRTIEEIAPELHSATSFCWGVGGAGWNEADWNDGTGRFAAMLARLKELDKKPPRKHLNQTRDIIIAETALKLGATLVSDDPWLRQLFEEFGGTASPSTALAQRGCHTVRLSPEFDPLGPAVWSPATTAIKI